MTPDRRIVVIADDFTGATDVGAAFVDTGRPVVIHLDGAGQVEGDAGGDPSAVEIFALKTRSTSPAVAVAAVREALEQVGYDPDADQVYFKYCSTFDSTPQGNIGPVLEALMNATGEQVSVVVPAFPDNGRTQYQGHLFVHHELLDESSMANHPVNPMRDSSVVRLLEAQSSTSCTLIPLREVRAPQGRLESLLRPAGAAARFAVVDAIENSDLVRIAAAVQDKKLVSGGSGLAQHYPAAGPEVRLELTPLATASRLILVGSQSVATQAQLASWHDHNPETGRHAAIEATDTVEAALGTLTRWLEDGIATGQGPLLVERPVLGEGTPDPTVGARTDALLAGVATEAFRRGVREFVVAGGETSASVLQSLGVVRLEIGQEISPGVPWCRGRLSDGELVNVALKSGNFGGPAFFDQCWTELDR